MNLYITLKEHYENLKQEALDEIQNARNTKEAQKAEGRFEGIEALWD